jgi:hypothetical protein
LDVSAEQRIRLALEAAAYHQANVAAPFVIKHLDPEVGQGRGPLR